MPIHKKYNPARHMFRALQYRNFKLFFVGQGISLVGTWMQQIAMSWLVYRMTNSPLLLGLVGFSSQLPTFIFSPIAGVLADRVNRYRLLFFTQVLAMAQAFIVAFLALTGVIEVWHILVLGFFLGCINAIEIPTRHSFVIDMVERKENLANAIALNSFLFNSARLIGPSIAGILISLFGEGLCFLLNGFSFIGVIISLLLMRIKKKERRKQSSNMMEGLFEGVSYVFGFTPIRAILGLLSIISLMGASYVVLMPVFAKTVLGGGASTMGFLMSSVGAGALVATFFMASRRGVLKIGMIIPVSALIFALGIIAFSYSKNMAVSMLLLAVSGFGFMVHMSSANTIIQTIVDDDKRGRVMSFYTMAFMGMIPLGSLLSGMLASHIGASNALLLGGAVCMLAAAIFARKVPALKELARPSYDKISREERVINGAEEVSEIIVPPED